METLTEFVLLPNLILKPHVNLYYNRKKENNFYDDRLTSSLCYLGSFLSSVGTPFWVVIKFVSLNINTAVESSNFHKNAVNEVLW